MNPELDLTIDRVIRAPREIVWRVWTRPELFAQWWLPAPMIARVDELDVRPGGGLVTQMSEDGTTFTPHVDAAFIEVDDQRRIVFTNAIDSRLRPADPKPVAMTARISFDDHPDGTTYRALVQHRDPAARVQHEELGFFEGWGAATSALAALAAATRP